MLELYLQQLAIHSGYWQISGGPKATPPALVGLLPRNAIGESRLDYKEENSSMDTQDMKRLQSKRIQKSSRGTTVNLLVPITMGFEG